MTVESRLRRSGLYDVYVAPAGRQRKGRIYRMIADSEVAAARAVLARRCADDGIMPPPEHVDPFVYDYVSDTYVERVETIREPEYVDVDVDRARRIAEANRARAKDRRIR